MTPAFRSYAWIVLLLQIACIIGFGVASMGLQYDNRIERFAIADEAAEQRYQTFTDHFTWREYLLITLVFRENAGVDVISEGDRIMAAYSVLPQIHQLHHFGSLPAIGKSESLQPFPFLQSERGLYTGVCEISGDRTRFISDLQNLKRITLEIESTLLEDIVLAGEPIVNDQLNKGSLEVRDFFFPILIISALSLLGVLFRNIKVLVVAGLSVGASLATTMGIVMLTGGAMDLVTTLIPALIFVLAVAMQMHVLISIARYGDVMEGLRKKLGPNFLVSLTTSIGFGSLAASHVQPIAAMGVYMAMGIWIVFFWVHVTHLGISLIIKICPRAPALNLLEKAVTSKSYWRFIRNPLFTLLAVVIIAGGVVTLVTNETESNGLNYFEPDHPIRTATDFIETKVTGSSHLEILIPRHEAHLNGATWVPGWDQLKQLENTLAETPNIRHLFSLNQMTQIAITATPGLPANPNLALALTIQSAGGLAQPFISKDFYRIQLSVNSLDRDAYEVLKQDIDAAFQQAGLGDYLLTGTLDRIIEIQSYLLSSLSKSLGITIAAIMVLMLIMLGHGRFLVILIPNLLPLACMALAMWVLGIKTTISTVMVFSIAFGIAVDDTVHLLHSYYHTHKHQRFRHRWRETLGQDARAILLTSMVLAFGFGVLTFSSFIPTAEFGKLMAVGMISAFIGDACFLPILLRTSALKELKSRRQNKEIM